MSQLFTPAQANRTLPLVRRIVADIIFKGRELQGMGSRGAGSERSSALHRQLREHLEELESIGCSYKEAGFELGLVDFPGQIEGEDVLLCWRSDEEQVSHYHSQEGGYAGRREIPVSLLGEPEAST